MTILVSERITEVLILKKQACQCSGLSAKEALCPNKWRRKISAQKAAKECAYCYLLWQGVLTCTPAVQTAAVVQNISLLMLMQYLYRAILS